MIPPYLKKGDTIGITCPAGYMPAEKAAKAIETLQQWGFKVKVGKTLGHRFNYFSGTDAERLEDLQNLLDDDSVKAILFGRGGYGMSRIIDQLDFKRFRKHPKWVAGFSDITVLHAHLLRQFAIPSLHSPMCAAFNDGKDSSEYVLSLKKALTGKKLRYEVSPAPFNRKGKASGILTGGNLSLLAHINGSKSDVKTAGKILFIEEIGEYLYNIDRMMINLLRSGKLDNLAGLVLGTFSDSQDTTLPFGQTVEELIWDKVKEFDYPVCFGFPGGHTDENLTLKMGVEWTLQVSNVKVSFKES
jgi:muramoyltetrapeptide carboxypeptidase